MSMNRQTMLDVVNGDKSLFDYWRSKDTQVPYPVFVTWFQDSAEDILASWGINTVYDKQGKIIKHY